LFSSESLHLIINFGEGDNLLKGGYAPNAQEKYSSHLVCL